MPRDEGLQDVPDLRSALRAGTDDLHRKLDGHPWQRSVLQPGLTMERYQAYLASHAVAYDRCERAMAAVEHHRPSELSAYRSRIPALRADLASIAAIIGRPASETNGSVDEAVARAPQGRADDDAQRGQGRYLGMRYVLDGATQGGFYIAERLTTYLPRLTDGPHAFWTCLAEEAASWKRLTELLSERPSHDEAADAAVAAARETFHVFLEAFDRHEQRA